MKRTFVPAHPGFFQLSAHYGDDGQLFRDDAGNPTCNRTPVLAWRVTEHEEEKANEGVPCHRKPRVSLLRLSKREPSRHGHALP